MTTYELDVKTMICTVDCRLFVDTSTRREHSVSDEIAFWHRLERSEAQDHILEDEEKPADHIKWPAEHEAFFRDKGIP